MASKIGGIDNRPVPVSSDRTVKRSGDSSTGGTESTATSETDPVQITGSARQLAKLEQHLQELPAVDEARVADISNAIANGKYKINAERVADKMLSMEDQLSHKLGQES